MPGADCRGYGSQHTQHTRKRLLVICKGKVFENGNIKVLLPFTSGDIFFLWSWRETRKWSYGVPMLVASSNDAGRTGMNANPKNK